MTPLTATRKIPAKAPRGRAAAGPPLLTVDEALRHIKAGKMIVVVDDADRENEGDIVFAA
jgi:3,4-dihydroxy 2-butanone 4-phosphate synthase/GTP cyclohydrolase II